MTKKVRLFLTMLFLTLLGGANAAWAFSVDITPQQALDGGVTPITVTCAKGDGTSNPAISSGQLRLYQAASGKTTGNTITFSSDYIITSIEFTFANGMTADNGEFSVGSYDSSTSTWTGSTNSVTLTVTGTKSSERIYITAMTVTYETGSAGPIDPTVQLLQERVGVGQTMQISYPDDLDVTFASTDNSVATVSEDGVITGVGPGTATISAIWNADDNYNSGAQYFAITVIEATTYEKVTDANQLVAGNEYILVAPNYNKAMGGVGTNIRNSVDVTVSDDIVSISDEPVVVLTLGGSDGAWTFLASDNNEYIAYSGSSNQLHSNADASATASKWTITNDFQLESVSTPGRILKYNSGSPRFACYAQGQQPAVLFVKSGSAIEEKASAEFAFSETSVTIQLDDEFTAPTLSYAEGFDGTIVYESSDPTVATVDESTGEVTIVGAGTTTITASSEATDNFQAGSASYTLTVTAPISAITIAEAREMEVNSEVLVYGIVTSVYTKTAYIQDDTGAIVVYGTANLPVQAGDMISVRGTITNYHGLIEIQNPTIETYTGDVFTVNVNNYTIDQITNDDQAEVVRIENATVTEINNQNVTIAQGENTILVRFNRANDITFEVDDVISLTGNIGCYDGPQIANPRDIEVFGEISYYLAGSMTDWADNKVEMTKNANGSYTLTGVEMAEGAEFKIIKMEAGSSEPVWLGGQADGNQFWLTAENHTNIPLVNGANFYMPIAGTWNITVSFDADNNPLITVDGSWPRKQYYVISDANQWDMTNMPEMTYNESKGVYEYTLTFRDTDAPGYNFAIADQQMESENWDDFNYNHRYSVQSGDYTLTENNSTNVQLSKVNGTMMVYNAGTYTLTLTEDLKLTVSGWPIVLDGNAYVKVTSTDDLTDGHYLIVYEGNETHPSVAFDGSYEDEGKLDAANNIIDVTIAEKLIVANEATNAAAFIIESTGEAYTIKSSNGKYIGKTAYANGLDTSTSTAYTNTIDFEDGDAVITASGNCILRYNYASDQQRFRYYKSGQQPIALYKLTTVEEIPVTIGSTGYGTLYYSDKALAIPEGMTAKYVSSVENGKITFTDVAESVGMPVIPAGTAVVLQAAQGDYTFFEVPDSETEYPANNLLSGNDEAAMTVAPAWAEGHDVKFYMLSRNSKSEDKSVGFYYAKNCPNGEAFMNGAHKAYLTVIVEGESGAKSFYLFSEAVTDGINTVEGSLFNVENAKIYNLNGQRVNTLQRGIYIINGKKVLVK